MGDISELDRAKPQAHHVLVVTDDDPDGFRVGRTVFVDDHELLLAEGTSVIVEVSNHDVMTATLKIIGDVEFRHVGPTELKTVKADNRFYPVAQRDAEAASG